MSGRIKQSSLDALLDRADLVEVISGYTSLRQRGVKYTGLCPFHQEKTASFTVDGSKGLYYCFGCGEGGNVFTFLQRMENLSFVEAAEQLAERFSVPLEFDEAGGGAREAHSGERRLLELLEKATAFYQRFLWESKEGSQARDYLLGRGFQRDVCEEYRVGVAPQGWRRLHAKALQQGFREQELEAAGLLVRQPGKTYDRFRGRLMFPLTDHRGRVVGFGGRSIGDESPKYLNSPEGPLYQKGRLLYGLFQARRAIAEVDEVLVVEGYTDVLGLAQAGVRNVVASMGTALTETQLELMTRFTPNVTFMFDADRAGAEAALRSGELARAQGLRPLVVKLPSGQDPADAATEGGAEAVARLTAGKVSILGYELERTLEKNDLTTSAGRVRAFEEVEKVLSRASSRKEREEEIRIIADRLRLSAGSVESLLRGAPGRSRRTATRGRSAGGTVTGSSGAVISPPARGGYEEGLRSPESVVEREFLVAAVSNPGAAVPLVETLTSAHFVDPVHRQVFEGLSAVLVAEDAVESLKGLTRLDSEVGRFFVRLAVETDPAIFTERKLEEQHLRLLELAYLREMAPLRRALEEGTADADAKRRLREKDQRLQQVRELISRMDE